MATMRIGKLYEWVVSLSPYIELFIRRVYWQFPTLLKKIGQGSTSPYIPANNLHVNFNDLLGFLKSEGIKNGSLLVVHSSMEPLRCTGLTSNQIIDELIKLVGSGGTIAMPVIRRYKGEPSYKDILNANIDNLVCEYNVKKSLIISGFIPYSLMCRQDSAVSLFPLNPLCAIGPLANEMMKYNIDGENPSPHGKNSSWRFCYDHNAIIVGLGVEFPHRLTMMHVFEESEPWPISADKWFRKRIFKIVNDTFYQEKEILERRPKWGMLHYAEITFRKDLLSSGVLHEKEIGGINVSVIKSSELCEFLKFKRLKHSTYPYYLCK